MKEKILVCGGANGFIGRNVVERLQKNKEHDVSVSGYDLTDKKYVDSLLKDKNVVIQAAATSTGVDDIINNPSYHVTDNAVMNAYIFKYAVEHKVKHVVFFSCTTVYMQGLVPDSMIVSDYDKPLVEDDFDLSRDIHQDYYGCAWTKVYNEKMCKFYSGLGDTKFTVIRHSNIYGMHDTYDLLRSHFFAATIRKIAEAEEGSSISVWGDGKEKRDVLFVSDLMDFVEQIIENQHSKFEIVNIGSGSLLSITDIVNKIIKASGKNLSIEYDVSKPSIKLWVCLNCNKAYDLTGWKQKTSIDDGIKETLDWYTKNSV